MIPGSILPVDQHRALPDPSIHPQDFQQRGVALGASDYTDHAASGCKVTWGAPELAITSFFSPKISTFSSAITLEMSRTGGGYDVSRYIPSVAHGTVIIASPLSFLARDLGTQNLSIGEMKLE